MAATVVANLALGMNATTALASTAAVIDTINGAEVFTVTPGKADGYVAIMINNVSALNGAVTFSIAAGDFWAAKAALTGSVDQGVSSFVRVESAKYLQSDGTIALTITPATGKKLKTDHTLTVCGLQL